MRAKLSLITSVGSTMSASFSAPNPLWQLPSVRKDETRQLVKVTTMKSCWPLPDLRHTSLALGIFSPLAHSRHNFGEALLDTMRNSKSFISTLPDPPPLRNPQRPEFSSAHCQACSWIHPL